MKKGYRFNQAKLNLGLNEAIKNSELVTEGNLGRLCTSRCPKYLYMQRLEDQRR